MFFFLVCLLLNDRVYEEIDQIRSIMLGKETRESFLSGTFSIDSNDS